LGTLQRPHSLAERTDEFLEEATEDAHSSSKLKIEFTSIVYNSQKDY